ncbi:MAG TPA: nucleoside triphosphate pyrophosphatase [Alphaproteobacteria bacterium]|nr:nucleoside triphosphate pyrophosphatase [Alphaproteobacteria bacterium]
MSSKAASSNRVERSKVVLASASRTRASLLSHAGVPCIADPAGIDEDEIKRSLRGDGASAARAAEALAELKALKVSSRHGGALVIGADQMLECDGTWFDKPADRAQARAQLSALRGRRHRLVAAVVAMRDGIRLWHHIDHADLSMRHFSDAFLDAYLDRAGDSVCASVGAYQLEGLGAQLFSSIEGDHFTILGLPLLPLLDFLRAQKVLPT